MSYTLFPLGDNALTIDYGAQISADINKIVLARFNQLQLHPLPGMIEAVPAYSSLSIFYDVFNLNNENGRGTAYECMKQEVEKWLDSPLEQSKADSRLVRVPVCYDGRDLNQVTRATGLNSEQIIQLHTSRKYRVYMLGFLPGFPYMGELDERLFTNRKTKPELVNPGSVAITGRQTGIYPLHSPGGWSIIGTTPLKLFTPMSASPTFFLPGDEVEFFSISKEEFNSIMNEHYNN